MALRPPIELMLAAPVDALPPATARPFRFEVKWDGWRAALFVTGDGRVLLQSRHARRLEGWFPDVRRAAREQLPPEVVLDGELISWSPTRERTDFAALGRRITAGRGLPALVVRSPAYFVAFDLLAVGDMDLRSRPLAERRARLEQLLEEAASDRIVLCPQTPDLNEARAWMATMEPLGIEGLLAKPAAGRYRSGRHRGGSGWLKWRARQTSEAIVGGVTGTRRRPETLLLGRYDPANRLKVVGRTVPLTGDQAAELGPLLTPPGAGRQYPTHPWPVPLPAGWLGRWGEQGQRPLRYLPVEPDVVVEVSTDSAYEAGRWRHPGAYRRSRPDLSPYDVPAHRWDEPE
ncbi:MAG: ATP-dependent DNA ligase [Actinocatenispora sp.]